MFLFELMSGHDSQVYQILAQSTYGSGNQYANKINAAASYAFNRWPQVRYHGPMYRAVRFDVEEFLKFNSTADVLRAVKAYKGQAGREFFSFAKTVQGVSDFVTISRSMGGDDYEDHDKTTIGVLVIFQQVGIGIDLQKMAAEFENEPEATIKVFGQRVGEVLSRMNNTTSIKLYHVIGLGDKLDDYYDDEDDGEGNNTLHWEKDFYYRPDQFNQLKRSLEAQFHDGAHGGEVPEGDPVDARSKMRQYSGAYDGGGADGWDD